MKEPLGIIAGTGFYSIAALKNSEVKVLKGVIIPCLIYLSILGIIGIIIF